MFTKKNLLILIGKNALIALLVISFVLIAISFISSQITRMSNAVSLNHRLEAELVEKTELFKIIERDTQVIGTNNKRIENAFVPSDNILEFVNILDSLAIKNTINQAYHFETPIISGISAPFPISTIIFSNKFDVNVLTLSKYFKEFDKLPYFTKIDGFTISAQNQLGWQEVSALTFRGTLYTKAIQ
ncbi:MAG: hypothetical protein WCP17_01255 [bacterium]